MTNQLASVFAFAKYKQKDFASSKLFKFPKRLMLVLLPILLIIGASIVSAVPERVLALQPPSIRVETAADGSGSLVTSQNLTSGSTLTVYSVLRDGSGTFVSNAAANWWFPTKTGGVANGDLVPASDNKSAVMTGHLVGTATISVAIDGHNSVGTDTITVIAGGGGVQLKVETAANGSGVTVPSQNLTSGSALTVYSISRDGYGNFMENVEAGWSFSSKTGGVVNGDLVAAGNNKSATMTGNLVGTGIIHANGGETEADSGTITVIAGAGTQVKVETDADGSGSTVASQDLTAGDTLTLFSIVRDASNNFVSNSAANWTFGTKTGGVANADLAPASDNKSAVMTGNLIGTGIINASVLGLPSANSGTITVVLGAGTQVKVETAANGSGVTVPSQNLTSGSTLTVYSVIRDSGGNFVSNSAANWTFSAKTGGVANGDLVSSSDNKSAVMTGNLTGTGIINASISGLPSANSSVITVIAGAGTQVKVETLANGSGVTVPSQDLNSGSTLTVYSIVRDASNNFVSNSAANWTFSAKTGGVANGDLVSASDNKSAVMTGNVAGTGIINAAISGLPAANSGTITVVAVGGGGGGGGETPPEPQQPINLKVANVDVDVKQGNVNKGTKGLEEDIQSTSKTGDIGLKVPEGTVALKADKTQVEIITVEVAETVPVLPDGSATVGRVFDLGPDGATFSVPLILIITYDPSTLPQGMKETDLYIAFNHNGGGPNDWVKVISVVDTVAKTVTAEIWHFSIYALISPQQAPQQNVAPPLPPAPVPPQTPPSVPEPEPTPVVGPAPVPVAPSLPTPEPVTPTELSPEPPTVPTTISPVTVSVTCLVIFTIFLWLLFFFRLRKALVFTTPTQTSRANEVSKVITVQVRNRRGAPQKVSKDTEVHLSSSSATGKFDVKPNGSFDGSLNTIIIPKDKNSANFYYKDNVDGRKLITAKKKDGARWKKGYCEL